MGYLEENQKSDSRLLYLNAAAALIILLFA